MPETDIWMPLYIGDYARDTMRLSTEQHGAYLLLLMEHWMTGPLPDDDEELAAITKLPLDRWLKHRTKIARFFTIADDAWVQKRVTQEKEAAEKRRKTAQENGRKGGRRKQPKTQSITQEEPTGSNPVPKNADFQNPEKSSSSSPSHPSTSTKGDQCSQVSSGTGAEIVELGKWDGG